MVQREKTKGKRLLRPCYTGQFFLQLAMQQTLHCQLPKKFMCNYTPLLQPVNYTLYAVDKMSCCKLQHCRTYLHVTCNAIYKHEPIRMHPLLLIADFKMIISKGCINCIKYFSVVVHMVG